MTPIKVGKNKKIGQNGLKAKHASWNVWQRTTGSRGTCATYRESPFLNLIANTKQMSCAPTREGRRDGKETAPRTEGDEKEVGGCKEGEKRRRLSSAQ